MTEQPAPAPIIIIKKKAGHGGHHGGAWKVAYADFVTAMMALFIVLWLLSSSEEVKKAVGGYFNDPTGRGKQIGSGLAGTGESLSIAKDDMGKLRDKIEQALKASPQMQKMKDQVQLTVTGEGLRVELLETEKGLFFESGRPEPSASGRALLSKLAQELGALPNSILIEGHTDSRPFSAGGSYSNWELSADRANAARRLMEETGLRQGQVSQVRGFAAQRLRKVADPDDPSNRRISVIVQYQASTTEEAIRETKGGGQHDSTKGSEGHAGADEKKPAAHHETAQSGAKNEQPTQAAHGSH